MDKLKEEIIILKKDIINNWNNEIKRKELKSQLDILMSEYKEEERNYLFNLPKYNSNDIVDLREQKHNKYLIYLHDKNEVVGNIEYKDKSNEQVGNIIYRIDEKYRGNNYAYNALCLLGEKLNEKGIDKILLCADEDNISSIKTIEKYNGEYIGTSRGICRFECNTINRKKHNYK